MPTWEQVLVGIIPSIGVGFIFWFAMRAVIRSDRNERAALAKLEAAQDAADAARTAAPTASDDAADDARETPPESPRENPVG